MAEPIRKSASASFTRHLRHVLRHLYHPHELRRSLLLELLNVELRGDPALALRRSLLQAISSLKPPLDVPAQADAWRTYQILTLRYVEQYSQREVGVDLSLSSRQVRREDSRAVHALADYLWVTHGLEDPQPAAPAADGLPEDSDGPAEDRTPSREQEIEWLRKSLPSEMAEIDALIQGVLRTVMPLRQSLGVRLQCEVPRGLPQVTAQQTAIRQALLNALTAAVRYAAGGQVSLDVRGGRSDVRIRINPSSHPAGPLALSGQDRERLAMAAELARLAGGDLAVSDAGGRPVVIELILPAAEQVTVLVVDDNTDTLELIRRYLAGTRYRCVTVSDPATVLGSVSEAAPDVILLDVMLPGIDGWELLERLREHPGIHGVPVIVCTILPQDDLALALGAAAFLRKPVSRRSLLAALDQQIGLVIGSA